MRIVLHIFFFCKLTWPHKLPHPFIIPLRSHTLKICEKIRRNSLICSLFVQLNIFYRTMPNNKSHFYEGILKNVTTLPTEMSPKDTTTPKNAAHFKSDQNIIILILLPEVRVQALNDKNRNFFWVTRVEIIFYPNLTYNFDPSLTLFTLKLVTPLISTFAISKLVTFPF